MRNLFSTVVDWIAALFAANGGAPHPIAATDDPRPPKRRRRRRRR